MKRPIATIASIVTLVSIVACDPAASSSPMSSAAADTSPLATQATASPSLPVPTTGVSVPPPSPEPPGTLWTATNPMLVARQEHTATLLPDGRVLVIGGRDGRNYLDAVEVFDPTSETWTSAEPLAVPRAGHTAVLLADGRLLVAGGLSRAAGAGDITRRAEVFDPTTGAWSGAGTTIGDVYGTVSGVALPDGSAVFHGTITSGMYDITSFLERFDPDNATWTRIARLPEDRIRPGMALLPDGRILIAGGSSDHTELPNPLNDAWILDPASGMIRDLPDMPEGVGFGEPAVTLVDGRVLVPGPERSNIFDPTTGTWTRTARSAHWRNGQVGAVLADSRLVLAGSSSCHDGDRTSEIYDVASNTWSDAGSIYPFMDLSMTTLRDGRVLLAGGGLPCDDGGDDGFFGPFADAFILDLAAP